MSDLMRWADGLRIEIAIVIVCCVPYVFIEIDQRVPLPNWVRNFVYGMILLYLVSVAILLTIALLRIS